MNATETLIDLAILFRDEPSCEIRHISSSCGGSVTHLVTYACMRSDALSCTNAAKQIGHFMQSSNNACSSCLEPLTACWTVRPI